MKLAHKTLNFEKAHAITGCTYEEWNEQNIGDRTCVTKIHNTPAWKEYIWFFIDLKYAKNMGYIVR